MHISLLLLITVSVFRSTVKNLYICNSGILKKVTIVNHILSVSVGSSSGGAQPSFP